jgi:hypothetical protein
MGCLSIKSFSTISGENLNGDINKYIGVKSKVETTAIKTGLLVAELPSLWPHHWVRRLREFHGDVHLKLLTHIYWFISNKT